MVGKAISFRLCPRGEGFVWSRTYHYTGRVLRVWEVDPSYLVAICWSPYERRKVELLAHRLWIDGIEE